MPVSTLASLAYARPADRRLLDGDALGAAYAEMVNRYGGGSSEIDFTFLGMARLAALVLMGRSPLASTALVRAVARLLDRDEHGMFCSEFVANAFVAAGMTVRVPVDGRKNFLFARDLTALDTLVQRANALYGTATIADAGLQARYAALQVRTDAARDGSVQDDFFLIGEDLDPWLVTPRDLFLSPDFGAVEPYGCPPAPGAAS